MLDTKISWVHGSWNPWTGCTKVSAECGTAASPICYIDHILERGGRDPKILALTQTFRTQYKLDRAAAQQGSSAICKKPSRGVPSRTPQTDYMTPPEVALELRCSVGTPETLYKSRYHNLLIPRTTFDSYRRDHAAAW